MTITFDPSTVSGVTLSNGNLTGSNTSTTNPTGCKGFAADAKSTGKLYFEITGLNASGGSQMSVGINTQSATYASQITTGGGGGGVGLYQGGSGAIFENGVNTGASLGGSATTTDVIGIAVDLVNMKFWAKNITQSGNWNNSVSANPATNAGGVAFTATPVVPFLGWGGGGSTGQAMTANFRGAFTGAIPAGFSAWDTSAFMPPWTSVTVIA